MPTPRRTSTLTSPALYKSIALAAFLVVIGLVFEQLATLLLLAVMTVIVAIPVSVVATRLERHRVPRAVGAAVALLGGLAVVAGHFAMLVPSFVCGWDHLLVMLPLVVDAL